MPWVEQVLVMVIVVILVVAAVTAAGSDSGIAEELEEGSGRIEEESDEEVRVEVEPRISVPRFTIFTTDELPKVALSKLGSSGSTLPTWRQDTRTNPGENIPQYSTLPPLHARVSIEQLPRVLRKVYFQSRSMSFCLHPFFSPAPDIFSELPVYGYDSRVACMWHPSGEVL